METICYFFMCVIVKIYKFCTKIKTFSQKINKDRKAIQKYLNFWAAFGTMKTAWGLNHKILIYNSRRN